MSEPTPGPLGFQENFLTVYQVYRPPLGTNAVAKVLVERDGGGCSTPREEAIANGYLFAAAPDLRDAAKELLEYCERYLGPCICGGAMTKTRAALAKAKAPK